MVTQLICKLTQEDSHTVLLYVGRFLNLQQLVRNNFNRRRDRERYDHKGAKTGYLNGWNSLLVDKAARKYSSISDLMYRPARPPENRRVVH